MSKKNGKNGDWKERKGELELQRKQAKRERKLAPKQAKMEEKLTREQQRIAVAHRSLLERAEATALIENVVAGLKAGKVNVEHGDKKVTVEPPAVVDVRVKAQQTWKTEELTIRVRWPRIEETEDSAPLTITSG